MQFLLEGSRGDLGWKKKETTLKLAVLVFHNASEASQWKHHEGRSEPSCEEKTIHFGVGNIDMVSELKADTEEEVTKN